VFSSITEQPSAAALLPEGGVSQGEQKGGSGQVAAQGAKSRLLPGAGKRGAGACVAQKQSGLLAKTAGGTGAFAEARRVARGCGRGG